MSERPPAQAVLDDVVESLHLIETQTTLQADAASWEKAAVYVSAYDALKAKPDFAGLRGQKLTRRINKCLVAVAETRKRRLPRVAFLSNARKLADVWGAIFTSGSKLLPYQHYSQIAVCSLPRAQKDQIRATAERDQPTREALRQTIRSAVDAHRGVYFPDFPLKVSNFWKFDSPHDNGGYGGIHPEVVANLLFWFTEPGDVILDPMAGSGVLACTLAKYRFFQEAYEAEGSGPRSALMADVAPTRADIVQADATQSLPFGPNTADFALIDPPYTRLGDTLDPWRQSLAAIIRTTAACLKPGAALAVVTDHVLRNDPLEPLSGHTAALLENAGLILGPAIYKHTHTAISALVPVQTKAARTTRLRVNLCKVIHVARRGS